MKNKGFTLIELLTAIMVCSIILTAIASLSFAINVANKDTDEMIEKQTRVRFTQIQLNELFKNCKMICSSTSSDIAIWTKDTDSDNQIDTGEIVYVDTGSGNDSLKILRFGNVPGSSVSLDQFRSGTIKGWLVSNVLLSEAVILEGLTNIEFVFDVNPPRSNFVSIKFDYSGPDSIETYEICSRLLSDSDYLIDASDDLVASDDD